MQKSIKNLNRIFILSNPLHFLFLYYNGVCYSRNGLTCVIPIVIIAWLPCKSIVPLEFCKVSHHKWVPLNIVAEYDNLYIHILLKNDLCILYNMLRKSPYFKLFTYIYYINFILLSFFTLFKLYLVFNQQQYEYNAFITLNLK